MKNMRSFSLILLVMALAISMAIPVAAAVPALSSDISLYTISTDDLIARTENTVKGGEITTTSFYNISYLDKTDLQQAAEASRKKGGKVFFNFDTLVDDHVIGRIVVNPFLVKDAEGEISLIVDTTTATNKVVTDKFTDIFGRKVAVMKCSQDGNFGFTVVIAGKLDITGMDHTKLIAYTYDTATNKYVRIPNAKCTVDEQGFVYLEGSVGGYIVITESR